MPFIYSMPDALAHSSATAPGDAASAAQHSAAKRDRQLRFVCRIHRMRTLGLGLGFLCIASVFRLGHESPFLWLLLAANAFVWPHVARALAMRSTDPLRSELRHLTLDSALGGVWVAFMHFNLLPSILLVTMLSVDKIGVGGLRFALRTTIVLVAACLSTWVALGFPVQIDTPMSVVVACLPLLVGYPLALSSVMYALATKVAQQNRRLVQLGNTDALTGLPNRGQALTAAEHELGRYRRTGGPAVLVILDIDQFKEINDGYGHPAGDQILRGVAAILRECARGTDTPARYAGDEFLLVLPDTDLRGAAELAGRIRERLAAQTFARAPDLRCTVSLGAAQAHWSMAGVEDWIEEADAALYQAKATGRDRLVSAPSPDRHPVLYATSRAGPRSAVSPAEMP